MIGFLSWPTPTAHDGRRPGADTLSTQGANLNRDAANWPPSPPDPKTETPGLESSQSDPTLLPRWPTPGANDYKGSAKIGQRRRQLDEAAEQKWPTPNAVQGNNSGRLDELGGRGNPYRGTEMGKAKLNPNFVDWMMGWPVGWTIARTGFDAREMASWRSRLRSLLAYLLGGQE